MSFHHTHNRYSTLNQSHIPPFGCSSVPLVASLHPPPLTLSDFCHLIPLMKVFPPGPRPSGSPQGPRALLAPHGPNISPPPPGRRPIMLWRSRSLTQMFPFRYICVFSSNITNPSSCFSTGKAVLRQIYSGAPSVY